MLYRESRPVAPAPASAPQGAARTTGLMHLAARHKGPLWAAAGALLMLALVLAFMLGRGYRAQADDRPLAKDEQAGPSPAALAYEAVLPSVVRVRGFGEPKTPGEEAPEESVGTGVVIVENGTILTNLHVVMHAHSVKVVFHDGLESEARVIGTRPEHDLAVLRAVTVPDDLVAATMRSTGDLLPGDLVVAVGFPFGIGPSATAGVVSGLKREYQSPEGRRLLTNLIQFDAAVNPGSSGGPLVTAGGEVVGIVTAILNPTEHRVFVGIGFAVPIENAAAAAGLPPF